MEELIGVLLSKLLDRKIREGRHDYIEEAREKAEELEYHFENEYPEKLLHTQHPSEEPWMKGSTEGADGKHLLLLPQEGFTPSCKRFSRLMTSR